MFHLLHEFERSGSLTSDHVWVVVRVDEGCVGILDYMCNGVLPRFQIRLTEGDDGTLPLDLVHLEL